MYGQNDLSRIKSNLSDNIGKKVRLTAKKGRKQFVTREGVIEGTYPSIFTVKLDSQSEFFTTQRRVSYSYADVLTKSVELVIYTPDSEETENESEKSVSSADEVSADSIVEDVG